MYSLYHQEDEGWRDLRLSEADELRADLDIARAERVKLENQLKSLQQDSPEAKVTQLAAELGRPVDDVKADVAAIRAASRTPQAPDPEKLSELLDKLDPNDLEGAARAFDQAGFVR